MNATPIQPDELDELVRRAIKNLRADGFDRQADAVQILAECHDANIDSANRIDAVAQHAFLAVRVAQNLAAGTGRHTVYRAMFEQQQRSNRVLTGYLEAILRAPTLEEAHRIAKEALQSPPERPGAVSRP